MKKIIISLLLFISLCACSTTNNLQEKEAKKDTVHQTTETDKDKKELSSKPKKDTTTDNVTSENHDTENSVIPQPVIGTWYNDELKIRYDITANTFTSTLLQDHEDSSTYDIIECQITSNTGDDTTYQLLWDINAYKQAHQANQNVMMNPQPIIFTYNSAEDTLRTSDIFYRVHEQ